MARRKSAASESHTLSPVWRRVLTAFILFHLTAVIVGPLSFPSRLGDPKNPAPGERPPLLAVEAADLLQPYLDLTYLRNGYRFFAPEPGFSSSRLEFELEFADAPPRSETIPDRNAHWPRLRYHRHFMLAEQVGQRPGWAESYCRHMQQKTGATLVRLVRIRRRVPFMDDVRKKGVTLPDPAYEEREILGEYTPD